MLENWKAAAQILAALTPINITPIETIVTLALDTDTAILAANANRTSLIIKNIGSETCNISLAGSDVTATSLLPLSSGESITLDGGSAPLTAVRGAALTTDGATGAVDIYVMEGLKV